MSKKWRSLMWGGSVNRDWSKSVICSLSFISFFCLLQSTMELSIDWDLPLRSNTALITLNDFIQLTSDGQSLFKAKNNWQEEEKQLSCYFFDFDNGLGMLLFILFFFYWITTCSQFKVRTKEFWFTLSFRIIKDFSPFRNSFSVFFLFW